MPTTASARISAVIRFYRWALDAGLILSEKPLWNDKTVLVQVDQKYGARRSVLVTSSELSIPNARTNLQKLEGGVIPVSIELSQRILNFAQNFGSPEICLLLRIGFGTGMRVSTILSLREGTVKRAAPHPTFRGWFTIAVGPSRATPVDTKFGTSGEILVPSAAIDALTDYVRSPRRLLRIALAKPEDRDRIFVTKSGAPFGNAAGNSKAMNTQISRLRRKATELGESCLVDFNFHRARATFGTELARVALKHGGISFAIWLVKSALMHKNERDTLSYIRFVQSTSILEEASDQFSREFFGMLQ